MPKIEIALGRFITGLSMHVMMTDKVQSGMDKMKYAMNHKWKFSSWSWRLAYAAGFAEVIINALVAIISYFVIT